MHARADVCMARHLFFFAVHKTRRIFLSPFISKASRRVSSFFLSVQLSQPYVATGHTSAFISRIFVEISMLWLFHIICSDAPIACPPFNLVRNSVVHSPSSVIRDPRYGNVSTCSSCSFWLSIWHAMPSLAITLVLSTLMTRLTWSRRSTSSCSSASEVPTGWRNQRREGSWLFALQFVVHLEIHPGSPSSPSPLGCRTSTEKGQPSTQPSTLRGMVKCIPAKGQWRSEAWEGRAGGK